MAALGTIRKRGVILIVIIGLGLFAFIAEEMFRSCEATSNERRLQVGEVLGKKLSVQDFQNLIDEYQEVIKMTQGRDNLTEDELNQVKDQVWNTYVNNTIVEAEADKLGLTVTKEELQNVLRAGTNPILLQTPFVNQQTRRFDASMLTKFLDDYKKVENGQDAQMAEQYQKDVDEKFKAVEDLYNAYMQRKSTLSQASQQANEENILKMEKEATDFQESIFGTDGTLMKRRIELIQPIQKQVFGAIETYAKQHDIDMVVDIAQNATMLYYSPDVDHTQDIIDMLKAPAATAPATTATTATAAPATAAQQ